MGSDDKAANRAQYIQSRRVVPENDWRLGCFAVSCGELTASDGSYAAEILASW
jgi:hypothetical protein